MSQMKSAPEQAQIVVLGGGPAGLAAALAIAHSGLEAIVVAEPTNAAEDKRTSALMSSSVTMLERLDVWSECADSAAPLRRLRLIDDTARLLRAPTVEFDAAEIGEVAFGWNVPNSALVSAMRSACARSPRIAVHQATAQRIEPAQGQVRLLLSDGCELSASLLIGADGRGSPARTAAGISTDGWSYDQAAIVANLRHERFHDNVSTEFHRRPGPFTLVPLPGSRSSLVWVEARRTAEALISFDRRELSHEIERLSHRLLGGVQLEGGVGMFPLSGLAVRRFAARRIALIGEAAHVMPPIGAQGLNLGLRDAAAVTEVVVEAVRRGDDPGSRSVLEAYDRARRLDVMTRTGAVDLLNRTLLADLLPIQAARAAGLTALGSFGPLRRMFMREGVAPRLALPELMRRNDPPASKPRAAR